MTPEQFTKHRQQQGVTLTAAVKEITAICSVNERTAWRWMQGQSAPPSAQLLLRIWCEAPPKLRAAWFPSI